MMEFNQRPSAGTLSRGHRIVVALVVGLLALAIGPSTAFGAPAAATLDHPEVKLVEADNGGWSAKVGITNLTTDELEVSAEADTAECDLKVGDGPAGTAVRPAAQHDELTVSIPATCKAADVFEFTLTASATGVSSRSPQ